MIIRNNGWSKCIWYGYWLGRWWQCHSYVSYTDLVKTMKHFKNYSGGAVCLVYFYE